MARENIQLQGSQEADNNSKQSPNKRGPSDVLTLNHTSTHSVIKESEEVMQEVSDGNSAF